MIAWCYTAIYILGIITIQELVIFFWTNQYFMRKTAHCAQKSSTFIIPDLIREIAVFQKHHKTPRFDGETSALVGYILFNQKSLEKQSCQIINYKLNIYVWLLKSPWTHTGLLRFMDGTVATSGDRKPPELARPRPSTARRRSCCNAPWNCCQAVLFFAVGLVLGGKMWTLCRQNMGNGNLYGGHEAKTIEIIAKWSKHPALCLDFVQSTQQETGSRHGDKTREKDTNNMWFCQCGSESIWVGEDSRW